MKVFEIRDAFGLANLVPAERPVPEPGRRQVRLRMRAMSLNSRDLRLVEGLYNPKQPLPVIPCSDGVGIVDAVGEDVTRVKPGDRVATLSAQKWLGGPPERERLRTTLGSPLDGTLAEYMILDDDGVVVVPEHLSDVEAATLPCAGLTAWSALVTQGGVTAGDTVLVQGTGGVSIFALQIAVMLGARVIATSSSDEKLERAIQLGAWAGINYRENAAWGKQARKLTGGVGVDHVVEVGGGGTLEQSLWAVRIGGTVSVIGVLAGISTEVNLLPILMQNVRLQGILVGSRDGFEAMNKAIAQHKMRPVVDRVFPFVEAPAAFAYMGEGKHVGKVCIQIES